jgi:cell pole-organizing protein PopZ
LKLQRFARTLLEADRADSWRDADGASHFVRRGAGVIDMAASNPSSDKEADMLRRAQRAHEPSMEEILASIRSIIADDRGAPQQPAPKAASGPQIVYTNDAAVTPRPAAPVEAVEPAPEPAAAPAPKVVWQKPEPIAADPAPAAIPEPAPADEAAQSDQPLVSEGTDAAVSSSFTALSATVAMQNNEIVEKLMREMLRPMLKAWLDDHLPSVVERLVRAEIQRVARGR